MQDSVLFKSRQSYFRSYCPWSSSVSRLNLTHSNDALMSSLPYV